MTHTHPVSPENQNKTQNNKKENWAKRKREKNWNEVGVDEASACCRLECGQINEVFKLARPSLTFTPSSRSPFFILLLLLWNQPTRCPRLRGQEMSKDRPSRQAIRIRGPAHTSRFGVTKSSLNGFLIRDVRLSEGENIHTKQKTLIHCLSRIYLILRMT